MTKRIIAIIATLCMFCVGFFTFPACDLLNTAQNGNFEADEQNILDIYTAYAENGGKLSYEEWLVSIKGADGVGIESVEKTDTKGLVDTYTITLSNGQTSTFTVTNGKDGATPTVEINDNGYLVINGIVTTARELNAQDDESETPGNEPAPQGESITLHPAKPAVESTISAELQAKLDHALTKEATDAEKAEAAMELYALANQNKINADKCLMVAQGDGKASVTISGIEAIGTMSVRAFKVQDNGSYYYQKGAKVTDTDTLDVSTLSKAIDKQERAYAPAGVNNYRAVMMSGAAARLAVGVENEEDVFFTELPFLQCDVTNRNGILAEYNEVIEDKDTFLERAFVYSGDPKEINNFNYRKEAISDVTIELFEDNGQNYYDINFMVDVTDEETVKVARAYLRESSGAPDLEFTYLKVNLKIWDNGYIRSFMDWEKWAGNAKIGPIDGKSSSDTSFEAVFYWDYDSLVADGILKADDEEIKEETFTADIIKKYASQPGWVTAE